MMREPPCRVLAMRRSVVHAVAAAMLLFPIGQARAMGGLTSAPTPARELADAKQLIDKYEYRGAIAKLNQLVKQDPKNADARNYLGYSHRKLKEFAEAKASYEMALSLDPQHKPALEYQGELLIETGDMAGAERNLATLQGLCPTGCEERNALAAAVAKARAGKGS
jgi:Flp pilus assembly protein TadD